MSKRVNDRDVGHIIILDDYKYMIRDETLVSAVGVQKHIDECRKLKISEKDIIDSIKVQIEDSFIPLHKLQNIC